MLQMYNKIAFQGLKIDKNLFLLPLKNFSHIPSNKKPVFSL